MLAKLKDKETWRRYFGSLKFALYCTTHPLDGYWDLTHEKRGTIAAANTILVLTLITRILKLQYTSFIFNQVYWPKVNIFLYLAGILFPLALWCVGNWGLTTLFDGKGTLRHGHCSDAYQPGQILAEFQIAVIAEFGNVQQDIIRPLRIVVDDVQIIQSLEEQLLLVGVFRQQIIVVILSEFQSRDHSLL